MAGQYADGARVLTIKTMADMAVYLTFIVGTFGGWYYMRADERWGVYVSRLPTLLHSVLQCVSKPMNLGRQWTEVRGNAKVR